MMRCRALASKGLLMAAVTERVRLVLVRRALRLEWPTAAWMVIEAAVAIGSGIAAHSLSLVAFGVDSVIELASSGVLLWRLNVELRWGMDRASPWIDIALGLLIAGPLAAWLPKEFW
jgi:hypothetical protein